MQNKIAEVRQMNEIPTLIGKVVASRELTPRMRRVTIGGEDLARFVPKGPDQFVYLLLPPPGKDQLTVDSDFTWTGYRKMPNELQPVGAYYTVRHHRPEGREIDLDMVLHESHTSEGGHASRWAATASPGEPVALWGPRVSYEPPETASDIYLFVDETGIPAASCIVESIPAKHRAHLFIEVEGPADEVPISDSGGVEVQWLHRDGAPPGSTTLLQEAARATPPPDPERAYIYGGAESRVMKAIRKHARSWGLPKESANLVAYWRATSD